MALLDCVGLRGRQRIPPASDPTAAKEWRVARGAFREALLALLTLQLGEIGMADRALDFCLRRGSARKFQRAGKAAGGSRCPSFGRTPHGSTTADFPVNPS